MHLKSTGSVARRLLQCVLFTFLIPDASSAQKPTAEDLRDLSRPVEPGAVALGLGGTRGAGLGDATDVASNPATVVLGPAGDVVISIGGYRYGRRELQRTRAGEGVADSWTTAVANPEPIGSVAAARRGRRFAVGGFYDATSRLDFSRSIDRVRRTGASAGEAWTDERQVSLGVRHERLGAGVGAVLPGRISAVGFEVHAQRARLRYDGAGTSRFYVWNPVERREVLDATYTQQAMLASDAWNVGMSVGALMRPHPRVDVGVRYAREPSSKVTLWESTTRRPVAFGGQFTFTLVDEMHALLDAPDVLSAGSTVRIGAFRLVGEAGVVFFAQTFRDAIQGRPGECRGALVSTASSGSHWAYPCWRLSQGLVEGVAMANGGEVRVGVERGWHQPKLSYWLRGGATREAAPVLQTRPPATNSFIPHESDRTWIHAGAGLRLGRFVTDIGLAFWQRQYRLLLDLRVATTRESRTIFGTNQ